MTGRRSRTQSAARRPAARASEAAAFKDSSGLLSIYLSIYLSLSPLFSGVRWKQHETARENGHASGAGHHRGCRSDSGGCLHRNCRGSVRGGRWEIFPRGWGRCKPRCLICTSGCSVIQDATHPMLTEGGVDHPLPRSTSPGLVEEDFPEEDFTDADPGIHSVSEAAARSDSPHRQPRCSSPRARRMMTRTTLRPTPWTKRCRRRHLFQPTSRWSRRRRNRRVACPCLHPSQALLLL